MVLEDRHVVIQERAIVLPDGARLDIGGRLDARWRSALSLRGRTLRYTDRVHTLIRFLARLRVGQLTVEGSEDGWAPYACVASLPGWERCHDKQRLREALLHELDLVAGRFFQRSAFDGKPRIRIAQAPDTIEVDDSQAELLSPRDPGNGHHGLPAVRDDGSGQGPVASRITVGDRSEAASAERGASPTGEVVNASFGGLILASPAIRTAFERVVDAARRGARLMLIGPSGSGKDGLARSYHYHGHIAGQFVSRNCSMFNRDLLRAELFGFERGAFTGALQRTMGAVEQAHGGTLFLDEIGEMPMELQPQLLSFLDHGEYAPLGASMARNVDVRIVCATNRDLRKSTSRGEFRLDLWYRLSQEIVEVPALRDRPADLQAYLQSCTSSCGVSVWDRLTSSAASMLFEQPWDGNFRELANFAERFRDGESSIDSEACQRALTSVALNPVPPASARRSEHGISGKWGDLAQQAASAFFEDFGREARSWDDLKGYIEQYLKPLLFAHLSGADAQYDDMEPRQLANRINADRGTAYKQLARYRERFHR
jgi:DNA-binding NtrC family response regulator